MTEKSEVWEQVSILHRQFSDVVRDILEQDLHHGACILCPELLTFIEGLGKDVKPDKLMLTIDFAQLSIIFQSDKTWNLPDIVAKLAQ